MAEGITEQTAPEKPVQKPEPRALPRGRFMPSGSLLGLLGVLALSVLLLAWEQRLGTFVTLNNLQVLMHQNCVRTVVALGMLLVIVSGGIDLSAGSVVALVTVVTMQTFRHLEPSRGAAVASLAAVAAGAGVGGLCGLVNGLVITRLRLAPFVATLGMMSIARGAAIWLAGEHLISFPGSVPGWVSSLVLVSSDYLFDPGVWSALALAGIMGVLLRFTVFGRYCYAIGSNESTARLCGVAVDGQKVGIYTLAGLLTGWAGVLAFAQNTNGDPNGYVGMELGVIAAVVIGGASLTGGQGTVGGTLLGVLMLGILENCISFFAVSVQVQHILIGTIVIVYTALSGWQARRDVA
jgi:ribose transport system permease protein